MNPSYLACLYVRCFHIYYSNTKRIPTWYTGNNPKYVKIFQKLYNSLLLYPQFQDFRTVTGYFLYSFAANNDPPTPEQLGSFVFIQTYLQNGLAEGKRLSQLHLSE